MNFVKFLRTPFSQNTSGRLLLGMLRGIIEHFLKKSIHEKLGFSEMNNLLQNNMCHFLFHRKIMFRSQDIQVFRFLTDLVIKLGQMLDVNKDNNFQESLEHFGWRTGAKFLALFNLATCCNYSITNYIKIPVFHFF